ncbi:MAG: DUF1385 domain-containing protein, partial [Desulfomonilaceae bacterium]
AYERGDELTVENAKKYPTLHARCGTAFILLVLMLSILLFTIVFPFVPKDLFGNRVVTNVFFILIKIALLPQIAGISYELIRLADKSQNAVLLFILSPGLWLQKLTTREPSDDQLEVAIVALKRTLQKEEEWAEIKNAL